MNTFHIFVAFVSDAIGNGFRRVSYFLMGYRRSPFTIIQLTKKGRFPALKAGAYRGTLLRGVFAGARVRDLASGKTFRPTKACYLWPDGLRWDFWLVALLIAIPQYVTQSWAYALFSFLFVSTIIPILVYGFLRLPVLDGLKEGMPKSVTDRVQRFPFRKSSIFVLLFLLWLGGALYYPLFNLLLTLIRPIQSLNTTLSTMHPAASMVIDQVIIAILLIALPTSMVLLRSMFVALAGSQRDFFPLFVPPIRDDWGTIFYAPLGSIKESLLRLALTDFHAKQPGETSSVTVGLSRSFFRYLFYWCAPVWGGYVTLWLLLLPRLLKEQGCVPLMFVNPIPREALHFSALLWIIFSAIFLWNQARTFNQWTKLGEDDMAMLPPVLFGKLKNQSYVADMLADDQVKMLVQIGAGVALTLYMTTLRFYA